MSSRLRLRHLGCPISLLALKLNTGIKYCPKSSTTFSYIYSGGGYSEVMLSLKLAVTVAIVAGAQLQSLHCFPHPDRLKLAVVVIVGAQLQSLHCFPHPELIASPPPLLSHPSVVNAPYCGLPHTIHDMPYCGLPHTIHASMPCASGTSKITGLSKSIISHSFRGRQRQSRVLTAGKQHQRMGAADALRQAELQVQSMVTDYGVDVETLSYTAPLVVNARHSKDWRVYHYVVARVHCTSPFLSPRYIIQHATPIQ
ncbi:hypothetical protein DFH29DRAFT_874888 [Suillus ampliporus]|nr:hypothetical protein DFH29DRAFT_874888 [Suillus ampliporus]